MDKRSFIKSVRAWDAATVERALAKNPTLATFRDENGKEPLHHCAGINRIKPGLEVEDSIRTAKALVGAGADVNAVRIIIDEGEEFHATPLWYAVAWGRNMDLARYLLENGADPNNCMWAAVWDQNLTMAQMLRDFGADIDPVFHDETPLLLCVKSKRLKPLSWLVQNGANINFQDSEGRSPLHFAVKRDYTLAQVRELLDLGADASSRANNGETPLSIAIERRKTKLTAMLERIK